MKQLYATKYIITIFKETMLCVYLKYRIKTIDQVEKSYKHQENHLPKILNYVLTCAIILKLMFTDKNTMYMKFVVIVKS